jgi:hypothetical protein
MSPSHQALLLEDEKAVNDDFRTVQNATEDTHDSQTEQSLCCLAAPLIKKRESVSRWERDRSKATANI